MVTMVTKDVSAMYLPSLKETPEEEDRTIGELTADVSPQFGVLLRRY